MFDERLDLKDPDTLNGIFRQLLCSILNSCENKTFIMKDPQNHLNNDYSKCSLSMEHDSSNSTFSVKLEEGE
ncbi:hypothetical protein EBU94_08430 [bacterium]|nr:hypothetical protein [bacterium]